MKAHLELKQQLEEIDKERNIIIQKLRAIKPKKGVLYPEDLKRYNEIVENLIGKCGILDNRNGLYVFKIVESQLVSSQIILYCDYMFISTSAIKLAVSYYTSEQQKLFGSFLVSKKFNNNTGEFEFTSLDSVTWIDFFTYYKFVQKNEDIEYLTKTLVEAKKEFIEKQESFSTKKIKEIKMFLENTPSY